eukprot:3732379-Pleurochrysis_carterae.AAC.4
MPVIAPSLWFTSCSTDNGSASAFPASSSCTKIRPPSAHTSGQTKSRPVVNITCPVSFSLQAVGAPTLPHPLRYIPAQSIAAALLRHHLFVGKLRAPCPLGGSDRPPQLRRSARRPVLKLPAR